MPERRGRRNLKIICLSKKEMRPAHRRLVSVTTRPNLYEVAKRADARARRLREHNSRERIVGHSCGRLVLSRDAKRRLIHHEKARAVERCLIGLCRQVA